MEKRTVLAIALSLLVLMVWSSLLPKPKTIGNKGVIEEVVATTSVTQEPLTPAAVQKVSSGTTFNFEQDKFVVNFNESAAAINEISFKEHQGAKLKLLYGFLLDDPSIVFKKQGVAGDSVTFVHEDENKKIVKRFIFSKSSYDIWLEINFENLSNQVLKFTPTLYLAAIDFSVKNRESNFQDIAICTIEKTQHIAPRKNLEFADLKFLGMRDRYFCAILDSQKQSSSGFIKKLSPELSEAGLKSAEIVLAPGSQIGQKYHIYIGPQIVKTIDRINPQWTAIINYGTFDFISQILLQLLEFIYRVVHSWGWSIIILSIVVYLVLYPLTMKQMRSMKEMQAIQPLVEALRNTYKDNPKKLNEEIMKLYKEHKVNPFGGCLPLLLQMPVFFALYQALMRSVALKGAEFLWIKDLSAPDKLFTLPRSFPVIGNEFNILPIIMAIEMFVQQKFTTGSASTGSKEQQKMMMILMPLMFGFIFYRMPSGLVLYWFVNSSLMLVNQIRVSKSK